jgi:hypothetical protein
VNLAAGQVLRLAAPHGVEVACDAGRLWITEEGLPDDVWLAPGERVRLKGHGLALVEASGDARLHIVERITGGARAR